MDNCAAAEIDLQEFIDASKENVYDIKNLMEIPKDTIPLFGDIYLALDQTLRNQLTKVHARNNKYYILKS